ncbi:Hemolysin HlyA [Parvularcula bermudensis HTCC2503]|uniref:Hemolysin HlyA n=1 Tax=Parvularcula bermudensis (strain ATCC BAA-594 / HTCC2503 / KCTC 12087) TaxID=314260 RepID=E0TC13_PARBH|nr:TlyA family RNA methyltransferase [Parvularcula bermudensis]ADM09806.1 Hemolysin HlyA [Parvularcula bermudensis HTCC2503]
MRLDSYLVEAGHVRSRERAKKVIGDGYVWVNGVQVRKAGRSLQPTDRVEFRGEDFAYVSRAAFKLLAALEAFSFDPQDLLCLDIGASTGGFTQVLCLKGARRVYAVDVGHGQLAPEVAGAPPVINLEGVNAKTLTRHEVPEPISFLTCDVSFISARKVLPAAMALCGPEAIAAILFKPQFELGPGAIGKGGLVTWDTAAVERVVREDMTSFLSEQGWDLIGYLPSPIVGGDGNAEWLVGARRA